MKILNLGSLNIDRVYAVDHFVCEGETMMSQNYSEHCGGKGLNQSIALKQAGADIYHGGAIGKDGIILKQMLVKYGVNVDFLQILDSESGHAVIQVTNSGKNSIIVHGGANQKIDTIYIDEVLSNFAKGDILLLQNEISNVSYAIQKAKSKGLKIVLNPSPITDELFKYPLDNVDVFILNEIEGKFLTQKSNNDEILETLYNRYPNADIVLTIGKDGVLFKNSKVKKLSHGVFKGNVVDTTAAGDTFSGFFLSCIIRGFELDKALKYASAASSLAISKNGAAESIPTWKEVETFIAKGTTV